MTNAERAKQIVDNSATLSEAYRNTEQALDEAEKRGAASRCDLGFNEGFISGQREMRERIVYYLKSRFPISLIEKEGMIEVINALPIEGE